MKKLESLKLLSGTEMNDEEMKKLRGGFDCGSGLTYYTGSCPQNGSGYAVCTTSQSSANQWGSGFCGGYGH